MAASVNIGGWFALLSGPILSIRYTVTIVSRAHKPKDDHTHVPKQWQDTFRWFLPRTIAKHSPEIFHDTLGFGSQA